MIVCAYLPRFALVVAAGGRDVLAAGPAALAPEVGREQVVGEVSPAAEAGGVHPGMRLGEALARCPSLALIPPDPVGVADAWETVIARLEDIGAAVEATSPGTACFDAQALARLYASPRARVLAGRDADPAALLAAGALEDVVAAARRVLLHHDGLRVAARFGAGPSRFCAWVGAARASSRRTGVVTGAQDIASESIAALRAHDDVAALVDPLEQLGIATLGALAALRAGSVADRFGPAGLQARALARGEDSPLRPRTAGETLTEALELPEAAAGTQLHRALELLVDRLLARRERRGRTLRAVVLGAGLVEGGTWRDRVVFREALSDAHRMRLALGGRLALLPAPAEVLRLTVDRFGPPHRPGEALFDDDAAVRRARLREAVRQARTAAGPDAALRVLIVEADSRVPERRTILTPFE